jgi:fatty-acyl-CoA synthase
MFTRHFAHWPPGQPKTLELPRQTVYRNLEASAARDPERAALDYYGARISYRSLKREVDALAGFLQKRWRVARGERVLLYLQNSPQFVLAYYAILRADAVAVPVNPMNRSEELRHYITDCGARTAVVGQDVLRHIEPLGLQHILVACYADYLPPSTDLPLPPFLREPCESEDWRQAIAAEIAPGPHEARPEDLAVMPYTSGTTGKPKGCMHTHSSVQATTVPYLHWRGAQENAVVLCALPMFHVTGMQAGMNSAIYLTSTIVLLSRWDRDCAAMQIERARVTNWSAITTMMVDFLANPNLGRYDLSSLEVLGGGGAAMPEAVARKLEEVIGLPFVEGYGLSETMAPTHINPPQRPKRQCAGIPFFNTDARVIDPETERELGVGEVGEIIVRGPQVFRGYWNDPQATAQAFLSHDGNRFFRTGDLGYYDEEGYFFITDRLKRMINCSGYKVSPAEVEAMLYAHPAIQEACVIGMRDEYRGETVKALIVLKKNLRQPIAPQDITAWARSRMAAFKVPRLVQFVDELPKTATGKIFWRKLQEEENRKAS